MRASPRIRQPRAIGAATGTIRQQVSTADSAARDEAMYVPNLVLRWRIRRLERRHDLDQPERARLAALRDERKRRKA
jgi:hypothetical protein